MPRSCRLYDSNLDFVILGALFCIAKSMYFCSGLLHAALILSAIAFYPFNIPPTPPDSLSIAENHVATRTTKEDENERSNLVKLVMKRRAPPASQSYLFSWLIILI